MSAMHPSWVFSQDAHQSTSDNDLVYQDESLELLSATDSELCTPSPPAAFPSNFPALDLSEVDISASKVAPGSFAIPRSPDSSLDPQLSTDRSPQRHLRLLPGIGSRIAGSGALDAISRVSKEYRRRHTARPHPAVTNLCRYPLVQILDAQACANEAVAESPTGGRGSFQREMMEMEDSEQEELALKDERDTGDSAPESTPLRSRWDVPNSWFIFPSELRNQIYDYAVQLPTSQELYADYYKEIHAYHAQQSQRKRSGHNDADRGMEPFPVYKANFRTPNILLVSHAITDECLSMLRTRTLVVDRIPPWLPGADRPMCVSSFVGRTTLQNLRHVDLRLDLGRGRHGSAWIWAGLAEDLLEVFAVSSRLTSLRVVLKLFQTHNLRLWQCGERYWYDRLLDKIRWFRANHSQVWSPPDITIEYWEIRRDWVYLLDPSGRKMVATLGKLTDPKLVPGSITDFLTA